MPSPKPTFEQSFASQPLSKYWSKKNDKQPTEVYKACTYRAIINCPNCPHEFQASLNDLNRGRGCPYCASKKLCDDVDCKVCFEKSFASSPRVGDWDFNKNDQDPRFVFLNANKKYWLKCKRCKHSAEQKLNNVTQLGNDCPFCAHKQLCDKDCKTCFEKSFASHPYSKYMINENPRNILLNSNKRYDFKCPKCNQVKTYAINHIVSEGRFCNC